MNDLIQIIKVLDDKQLKIINNYVDTLILSENSVFDTEGKCKIDTSVRSSLGSYMNEEHEVTKLLHEKINETLLIYREKLIQISPVYQWCPVPGGFKLNSHREAIQILEYKQNQQYMFHHDTANDPNMKEYHRMVSVIIYLNGGFEGGGTEFTHQTYKPSSGYGIFFPSNWSFPHSGQKVLSGKKRVAVTWYYVNENSIHNGVFV